MLPPLVRRTALLALATVAALAAQPRSGRPNIVLVLADDLGYGDPGCYNDESRIPTPHIDRLAAQGLRFTDAHSPASVCTPTRYGILTGRYAWRTRLPRGVLWPWDPPLLEPERLTLPELLRARGYRTACIGKWHLGWDWPLADGKHVTDVFDGFTLPPARRSEIAARIDFGESLRNGPLAHGFDHYFGDDVPNFPPYAWIEDDRLVARPTAAKPADMFGHAGPMAPGWDLSVVLPTLAQRAASWIDERARDTARAPFFLFLSLTAPHTPIAPSPHFTGTSAAGAYGDWVAQTDHVLGVVLEALDRNELTEHTLVLFTSDNGSPQRDGTGMAGPVGSVKTRFGHDPSRPWRGLKSDAWEGGHRVPFVARWPGRTPAGATSDEPLVLTDLYRTIAGLVGHPIPAAAGEDSFDLRSALLGETHAQRIRDHLVHHSGNGVFAIREGRFKLILGKGSGGFSRWTPPADAPDGQLYDLATDPAETTNLYRAHPDIVARLGERLQQLREAGRSAPRSD